MKFVPIDPTGKTVEEIAAECAAGINQLHNCVHAFQAENQRSHAEAAEKRHQMADEMMAMQGEIRTTATAMAHMADNVGSLAKSVGELTVDRDLNSGRIKRLAELFGADDDEPSAKKLSKPIGTWDWKHASIAGIFVVLAAIVSNAAVYGLVRKLAVATDEYLVQQSTTGQQQDHANYGKK